MPAKAKPAKTTSIRINPIIYSKLQIIAELNGRSLNSEMEQMMIKGVAEFEKKNGVVKLNAEEE